MIVYNLKCRKDHVFEAWFRDSAAYDEQAAGGKLACPTCGSGKVEKALMAPRLGKSENDAQPAAKKAVQMAAKETQQAGEAMKVLRELRRKIEDNFDYVGPGFAEEARKIHYREAEARNIYGETSEQDAEALKEEGVGFGRIPWVPRQDS